MAKTKRISSVTPTQIIALRGSSTQVEFAKLAGITARQLQRQEAGQVAMSEQIFEFLTWKLASAELSVGERPTVTAYAAPGLVV